MRSLSLLFVLAACGGAQRPPLAAQMAVGPANTPPGGVLVMSAQCAGMQATCPRTWAPAVDAIVTSGLSFHGYTTLDPSKLRKDEAGRTETNEESESHTETHHDETTKEVGAVAIIPFATYTTTKGTTVTMSHSTSKTVVITGATLEELTIPDRKALMQLAGANSLLQTQIVVGANWSAWTTAQSVEVMVKLSDAFDGSMRWSARCSASSGDYPSAAAAIEAAAHCVSDAMTAPPR